MSFLSGPADCGPVNPLAQLSKASAVDQSLHRDRFVSQQGHSNSSLRNLPSSSRPQPAQHLQPGPLSQTRTSPLPFDLGNLQQALPQSSTSGAAWGAEFQNVNPRQSSRMPPDGWNVMEQHWGRAQGQPSMHHVTATQHPQASLTHSQDSWDQVFQSHIQTAAPRFHQPDQAVSFSGYDQSQQMPMHMPYQPQLQSMGMSMGGGLMYQQPPQPEVLSATEKGKGKEASWEDQFEKYSALSESKLKEDVQTVEKENGKGKEKEADLEEIWKQHQDPPHDEDVKNWEQEFSQFANGSIASAYEELEADQRQRYIDELQLDDDQLAEGTTDERGFPRLGKYEFERNNRYLESLSHLTQPPTEQSSLSDRALFLEAAIQSKTKSNSETVRQPSDLLQQAESWLSLGETQTQDEKELAGIRALEAARDEFESILSSTPSVESEDHVRARYGLGRALMSLAVSYTNESYDEAAYLSLHRYLTLTNPEKAAPLPPPMERSEIGKGLERNPWEVHAKLTESFLQVAREENSQGRLEPGTQMALGLLYYSNEDYELSADCWSAALNATPGDFLLWNRLGATLANGGRPEEAIDAYRQALAIHPAFTRAVYNLGVSCLNIGVYQEAAEHLLSALSLHETSLQSGGGGANGPSSAEGAPAARQLLSKNEAVNQSQNLWSTLRRAFYAMDRPDLAELAVVGADINLFRKDIAF